MRTMTKLALAGVALIGASGAYADVALPDTSSSGNGELTLFVKNNTTGAVYARGLQITMNDVLSQATITADTDTSTQTPRAFSYSFPTITPDANLTSFLAGCSDCSWTVMAGDSVGSNAYTSARRYLTTSPVDLLNNSGAIPTNNAINSIYSGLTAMLADVNTAIPGSTVGDGASTSANGAWGDPNSTTGALAQDWFGAGLNNANAVGQAAHLYVLTSGSANTAGGTSLARVYQALDVKMLADGTLQVVSAVPLPGAVWLFGSALAGLAGVSRRRREAAAA